MTLGKFDILLIIKAIHLYCLYTVTFNGNGSIGQMLMDLKHALFWLCIYSSSCKETYNFDLTTEGLLTWHFVDYTSLK